MPIQKLLGHARVLAQNEISLLELFESTDGDVSEIAYGSTYDGKSGHAAIIIRIGKYATF